MKWYGILALVFSLFALSGIVYMGANTGKMGFWGSKNFERSYLNTSYFKYNYVWKCTLHIDTNDGIGMLSCIENLSRYLSD